MFKPIVSIILLSFTVLLSSCSDHEIQDRHLYFIGDSMIANWDLEDYFPNRITTNYGKDGRRIADLADIQIDSSSDIVLLIGTNDLSHKKTENDIDEYAHDYLDIISSLGGREIFLVSVLPTSNWEKNERIVHFNKAIVRLFKDLDHYHFIDCYDDFLYEDGSIKCDLFRDGLHLTDYGYQQLTNEVRSKLKQYE